MGLFDFFGDIVNGAATGALDVMAKANEEAPKDNQQSLGNTPKEAGGKPLQDQQSLAWDPFAVIDALGFKERPSSMSYAVLNAMVYKMPILQTVIKTRVDQVGSFGIVQEDKFQTGFRIQQRDRKKSPTPATERRSQEIQNWLLTTGTTEQPLGRDSFRAYLKKITRDSLTYDAMTTEVRYNNFGNPYDFIAVDAASIRYSDTSKLHYANVPGETRFVQIYDNLVNAEYTADELLYGIRNPVTELRNQGYGRAETEMLVSTVTSLLYAMEYNTKQFSQGTMAKGIINFKGTVNEKMLRGFRRHWYSMVAGVENAFKTPILAMGDDLQYVDLQKSSTDMEFNAWFDFLIKITCSIFGMDPMEINFKYGDSGSSGSMFETGNRAKLGASKDKGLKPLLEQIADMLNTGLVQKIDPDFELKFVGLDAQSPSDLADLTAKQVKSYKTVDEARAEEDLAPLPDGLGEVILDSTWLQNKAQEQAPDEMPGEEGEFGGYADDEDGPGDEDAGDSNPFGNKGEDDEEDETSDEEASKKDNLNKSMGRTPKIKISVTL